MDISLKLQGKMKGVLREFSWCFKEVSRLFLENFTEEEVSRMFQWCFMIFKGVSRVFHGSFKKTFKVFQKILYCMALIAASRAEGGLVSTVFPQIDIDKLDLINLSCQLDFSI